MKVVLFCGGFGLRMRGEIDDVPKPMVRIGYRPVLWHVMRYYAHYGHKDFVLCLGWKADVVKRYFLEYDECMTNDFTLREGGDEVDLLNTDISDWNITFVDTGHSAKIGERLMAVRRYVDDQPFLANYTDGLTDFHLPRMTEGFDPGAATGAFLAVKPRHSFHAVDVDPDGRVRVIQPIERTDVWMNGGFFLFSPEIFDYMQAGDELVEAPFQRLIAEGRLFTWRYDGFWSCMDTFKEKVELEELWARGGAPWEVWKRDDRAIDAAPRENGQIVRIGHG